MALSFTQEKIRENFYCFTQRNVRCFLFIGPDGALLVDSGFGGDLATHCRALTPAPITLLLTHSDQDHTGCCGQFESILMHPDEFDRYARKHGHPAAARPVSDGAVIDLGTFCFEVIHTPGHTPGSIVLLERRQRFLLAGDTVQDCPIYMFGDGRDLHPYADSLRRLLQNADAFDIIYSAHGSLTPDKNILGALLDFTTDLNSGICPPGTPPENKMPDGVLVYEKDGASFLLEC